MARYYGQTLVLTVTFSTRGNLLHESCTGPIYRVARVTQSACVGLEKLELREQPRRNSVRRPTLDKG
jgi:hypothetical protein